MSKYIIALLAAATLSTTAYAEDGKALYVSKGCVACHGADADTPIMPVYPKLAGQNKEYALQQMKDIKSGARSNAMSVTMKGIIANVSDEEMAKIAEYLAGAGDKAEVAETPAVATPTEAPATEEKKEEAPVKKTK